MTPIELATLWNAILDAYYEEKAQFDIQKGPLFRAVEKSVESNAPDASPTHQDIVAIVAGRKYTGPVPHMHSSFNGMLDEIILEITPPPRSS